MHGAEGAVKLEDCQYKGRNTFVGAEQKWELKDVSVVFCFFCELILDFRFLFMKVIVLSFSSYRTSYSSSQDGTCVSVPVMSIPLWPSATPQTDTSSGPSSECANYHFILYCMQLTCRGFRLLTTLSFNLFLYIEELNCCCWKVWTLGETTVCHCWKEALKLCSQSDCELRFLEQ